MTLIATPGLTACVISISAPVGYQFGQLTVNLATDEGSISAVPGPEVSEEVNGRMWWRYSTQRMNDRETPMISFTDRHGALYYQYHGITRRFGANEAFSDALPVLRDLLRSGAVEGQPLDVGLRSLLSRVTRGRLGKTS